MTSQTDRERYYNGVKHLLDEKPPIVIKRWTITKTEDTGIMEGTIAAIYRSGYRLLSHQMDVDERTTYHFFIFELVEVKPDET